MHNFWMMIYAHTAVSVAAGAATTTVLVQLLKTMLPGLVNGKKAVAVTVAMAAAVVAAGHVAAVYLGMNPPGFWSEAELNQVLGIAAAASAVHGTFKALMEKSVGAPESLDATPRTATGGGVASALNPLNTTGKDPQIQNISIKS